MTLILIIDGGATKTALSLRTTANQVLFETQTTSSNYQAIGGEKVFEVLHDLMLQVSHQLQTLQTLETPNAAIEVAVFGLAGIDSQEGARTARRIVEHAITEAQLSIAKVIVENDAQSTMLGATNEDKGALLISGTGAIAYGTDGKGNIYRSGGWGHRVGDEGSGYWIGQEILRAVFRMEDGRGEHTLLKQLVYEELEIETIDEASLWIFRPTYTNAQIASMTSLLKKAIMLGDSIAIKIAQQAANELALLGTTIIKKIGATSEDHIPLFLNGGAILSNDLILQLVSTQIHAQFPNVQITPCTEKPIEYIARRALQQLGKN